MYHVSASLLHHFSTPSLDPICKDPKGSPARSDWRQPGKPGQQVQPASPRQLKDLMYANAGPRGPGQCSILNPPGRGEGEPWSALLPLLKPRKEGALHAPALPPFPEASLAPTEMPGRLSLCPGACEGTLSGSCFLVKMSKPWRGQGA